MYCSQHGGAGGAYTHVNRPRVRTIQGRLRHLKLFDFCFFQLLIGRGTYVGRTANSVLFHSVHQRLTADVQISCRVRLVPVELVQRSFDQFLFHRFQADALRRQIEL